MVRKLVLVLALIFLVGLVSAAQCNDGTDNDGDGNTDYPSDTGCTGSNDTSEDVVLGYAHGCLTKGDKLYDVFGNVQYSCGSTSCNLCVLMAESGNYSTLPSKCNGLTQCGFGAGSGGIDVAAPNITVDSPAEGKIYNSTKILVDLNTSEEADVSYKDLDAASSKWNSICSDCDSYSKEKTFKEGENNLQFKVSDSSGNTNYFNVSFTVDSISPKVKSTSPTGGFVSSTFEITFDEASPTSLVMTFGSNSLGFDNQTFDLDECTTDPIKNERKTCSDEVDLSSYDGSTISYWFTLKDVANNTVTSKSYNISVDETSPVINNPESFYSLNFKKGNVDFNINVTELNLDEVGYLVEGSTVEKRICDRLTDGICKKSISFVDGSYNVTLYVRDKAGNEETIDFSFLMDSKAPKITGISPKSGFADGNFEVKFKEKNPETVTLNIEDEAIELDLEECTVNIISDQYVCSTFVDLSEYDGSSIEYYFTVEDAVGNDDESSHKNLDVDTTFPVVNNPESFYTINGKIVFFSLNIEEDNFEEATYEYLDANGKKVERVICSRLNNAGYCEKKISFKSGTYNLTVNVIDEASNKLALPANFVI